MARVTERMRALLAEAVRRRLRVYDCDDTLISSDSTIRVQKADGERLEMDSGAFACYSPSAGDVFDFSDFNHVNNPRLIKKNFEALKADAAREDTEVVVLTARPKGAESAIQEFLENLGIMDVRVVALASSSPVDKGSWVAEHALRNGYRDVGFVDDSHANVQAVTNVVDVMMGDIFVKGDHVAHPHEDDYAGPPISRKYVSRNPTTALVPFGKTTHAPSEWWKSQTDEFKRRYCKQHPGSDYCQRGTPL